MPHRTDLDELLEKRKQARIVEGFIIRPNATPQLPFTFSAEINIDNDRLWNLFLCLSDTLPDEVTCSYGMYTGETESTGIWPIDEVLDILGEFATELTQDGFLLFGLVHLSRTEIVELHVTESKYIRYSGSDLQSFTEAMVAFELMEIPELDFVDEFPKIVDPLRRYLPDSLPPEEVIAQLKEAFS